MSILGREKITRRRFAADTRGADGRTVKGAAVDVIVWASVQPASDDDLQTLPEGERSRQAKTLLSKSELRVADEELRLPADHALIDGDVFEVRRVSRERAILPHYRAVVVKLQEAE